MARFVLILTLAGGLWAPRARAAPELFGRPLALTAPDFSHLPPLHVILDGDGHEGRHVLLVETLAAYLGLLAPQIAIGAAAGSAVNASFALLVVPPVGFAALAVIGIAALVASYVVPPLVATAALTFASRYEGRRLSLWKLFTTTYLVRALFFGLVYLYATLVDKPDPGVMLLPFLAEPAIDLALVRLWDPPTLAPAVADLPASPAGRPLASMSLPVAFVRF